MLDQTSRVLRIKTPLGPTTFLLLSIQGQERVSSLYSFQLKLLSEDVAIKPADIVGQEVTAYAGSPIPRCFSGIVSEFRAGRTLSDGSREYIAVMVPKLWVTTLHAGCKIFQEMNVQEIITEVLSNAGVSDYSFAGLKATYAMREYCVQFNESDFDFISRLMEEEGISYYFAMDDGSHTLNFADHAKAFKTNTFVASVDAKLALDNWERRYALQTGSYKLDDYNAEKPVTKITSEAKTIIGVGTQGKGARYLYGGRHLEKKLGDHYTKVRMESDESRFDTAQGASKLPGLASGTTFKIANHDSSAENGEYLMLAVDHYIEEDSYQNSFECMPSGVHYSPPFVTPRPMPAGVQVAVVVGPSGEEIYTDKFGRIKVQFHWDIEGQKDERSSCFMRVSQAWAGKKYGSVFIPRIGQEVIVDFVNGDIDFPIVTGAVYNGENLPPFDPVKNKTVSGLKSKSSKGGAADNFNEFSFDDLKDKELINMQAEKDFKKLVKNDETTNIGNDQTETIKNQRTVTIEEKDDILTVGKGNQTITIKENQTEDIGADHKQTIGGDSKITIDKGQKVSVAKDQAIDVTGAHSLKVTKDSKTDAKTITLTGKTKIELKVGSNKIEISNSGIKISGIKVDIEAKATCNISGAMVNVKGKATTKIEGGAMAEVKGGGMVKIQGGITMIN